MAARSRCVFDLTGGVAQEGDAGVLRSHAAAVVAKADEGHATVLNLDGDMLCTGVDGVFQQLLDDGARALNDLACGDKLATWGES